MTSLSSISQYSALNVRGGAEVPLFMHIAEVLHCTLICHVYRLPYSWFLAFHQVKFIHSVINPHWMEFAHW